MSEKVNIDGKYLKDVTSADFHPLDRHAFYVETPINNHAIGVSFYAELNPEDEFEFIIETNVLTRDSAEQAWRAFRPHLALAAPTPVLRTFADVRDKVDDFQHDALTWKELIDALNGIQL